MRAFFKAKDSIKADEIAARQLHPLKPYNPPRAKKLRLDVLLVLLSPRSSSERFGAGARPVHPIL
jgi:hypothetical protein